MSRRELDIDFSRPAQNGVYHVSEAEFATLARSAEHADVRVHRLSLANCKDKSGLLALFARALALPASAADNWDALADCLRDSHWLPNWGNVFLLQQLASLQRHAPTALETLRGVLDDAATYAAGQDRLFIAIFGLTQAQATT